ncbi:MAG: hypothetical protein ACYTFH_02695, partial [Planctomycetota bacterium]
MHPTLFNLVAWILLFAQGLVSIGAGQTLCIPFQSCGRHAGDHGHSGACGELETCGGLQVERIDGRGPVGCAGHDHDHHTRMPITRMPIITMPTTGTGGSAAAAAGMSSA